MSKRRELAIIVLNGVGMKVDAYKQTYEMLSNLAGYSEEARPTIQYIGTSRGVLLPGQSVVVHDGMIIDVVITSGS